MQRRKRRKKTRLNKLLINVIARLFFYSAVTEKTKGSNESNENFEANLVHWRVHGVEYYGEHGVYDSGGKLVVKHRPILLRVRQVILEFDHHPQLQIDHPTRQERCDCRT